MFLLPFLPRQATLYFVGPYNSDIFVNGTSVSHFAIAPDTAPGRPVIIVDVSSALNTGLNSVAIEASASDVFALKIVPAEQGINAPPLLSSDATWRAATTAPTAWEQPSFNDTSWPVAQSFGSIESDANRFKGNWDLGMYQWPGYQGLNALLNHSPIEPVSAFKVSSNSVMLDFGKEIAGRLEVLSSNSSPVHLQVNLGESQEEATPESSFLGTRDLVVPPFSTTYGPLTGFRFALVVFVDGQLSSLGIRADLVIRNLPLTGSFKSSDPVLNKIWEISAYTAQLGLQSVFFDGPKRDRNPFAGDLYVAARSARSAFGHSTDPIVKITLDNLLERVCAVQAIPITGPDINCIPTYNAWWILALGDLYRFTNDTSYLREQHDNLVKVLAVMQGQLSQGLFQPDLGRGSFADWSPGMFQIAGQSSPDLTEISTMVYYMAFREAAFLFEKIADSGASSNYVQIANTIKASAIAAYLQSDGTFGSRVQTNAMAIYSGIADDPALKEHIFSLILNQPPTQPVTPYFNYFVVSAMEKAGHRAEAIQFVKQFWGSMLDSGATTFWELYSPTCVKRPDFHSCLMDYAVSLGGPWSSGSGIRRESVSLAHAWSSGPAAFLSEIH